MLFDGRRRRAWAIVAAVALATLGAALTQAQDAKPDPAAKADAKGKAKRPGLRLGAPQKKAAQKKAGDDPMAEDGQAWPFHYTLKLMAADGNSLLHASYYPSKLKDNAPVLLLVHDRGLAKSGKDFETPIADLKGQTFAEHLQEQEYAVLVVDLRGRGNVRREIDPREWRAMVADLQAAYHFLIDRHNRRELNVGKLGVIALGAGANLAASWAAGGGAIASEGRVSDLGAMALVSPLEDADGLRLSPAMAALAPRVQLLLIAGTRGDEPVKAVKALVERKLGSKVVSVGSPLTAEKLLNFFPGVPATIVKFFDDPIKFRSVEWEPRYLLTPTRYTDVKLITKADAQKKKDQPAEAAKKADAPAAKKKGGR